MAIGFNTENAIVETYRAFIKALRDAVSSGREVEFMAVLRNATTVPANQRFIEVVLTNDVPDTAITLAIDITNMYVVAYRSGDSCWFLDDADYPPNAAPGSSVFPDIPAGPRRRTLRFSGRYEGGNHSLQSVAGSNREGIELGMTMLGQAIGLLSRGDAVRDSERARSFIIIIQMISEAVRFQYIENRVTDHMPVVEGDQYDGLFEPDMHMLSLENSWSDLSQQIQRAQANGGAFPRPLTLHDRAGNGYNVDEVTFNVFAETKLIKHDEL
ncbi:hypothetical protein Tsubulata_028460 [Turnera subulata]|uniref:rRNA N-glycosylase n=1 Tax=Turnera subulata TaxID=218843 RepID=A0A9Q0F1S4_9ROSI|nr:hypothetical protein Tsubulata_028460 [Turnera subulata]